MGRLVRVILYAFIVIMLYFWITSLLKSYQQKQELKNAGTSEVTDTSFKQTDTISLSDEQIDLSNEELSSENVQYEALDKAIDELSVKENKKESPKTVSKQESGPDPAKDSEKPAISARQNTGSGPFMVIAGSFIKEENARQQLTKLRSLGYNSAEIKIFVSSEYHSVIVSRHATPSEAEKVVQDLRKNGVESFVKEKK
jgi:cell division septation protein DedD